MNRDQLSESDVAQQWNLNADLWTEQVRAGWDIYREHWNNPAFLPFVGDLAGKDVLDAGCGEGYNTRIFARRGGRMIGVDLSPRMIERAREEERREPLGIRYEVTSYSDLGAFADDSFDACVSTMALMDGPDFPGAMREIRRVMKPGAPLCFSILHPCFATKGLGWLNDAGGHPVKFTVADYFDDTPWVDRWKFGHAPNAAQVENFRVPRFDRTLSHYLNALLDAGLVFERIDEPRASEDACRRFPALQRWRDHIPLYLHVRARKHG